MASYFCTTCNTWGLWLLLQYIFYYYFPVHQTVDTTSDAVHKQTNALQLETISQNYKKKSIKKTTTLFLHFPKTREKVTKHLFSMTTSQGEENKIFD